MGVPPTLVSFHLVGNFPLKHDYGRKGKSKFQQMIFWKKKHTPSATNSLRLSIYFATRRQWQFLMCYKEVRHYLTQNESEKPCGSKRKNLQKNTWEKTLKKSGIYSTTSTGDDSKKKKVITTFETQNSPHRSCRETIYKPEH